MPKAPPKTREEYIDSGIRMYNNMAQYRSKVASGEMTDEDIYIMAEKWADKQIENRIKRQEDTFVAQRVELIGDDQFREEQEARYREGYIWEGANDEASLQHLINLEVEIRRIKKELDTETDDKIKAVLRRSLSDTTKEHRTLQEKTGIDRLTRSKAEAAKSTVDDWDRIKREAKQKLETLAAEFAEQAKDATSEAELRDRMKYHFAIPFDMVDSILGNHRRVLGLDPVVQES